MGKGFGERDVETFLPSKTLIPIQPLGLLTTSVSLPHYHSKACMKLIGETQPASEGWVSTSHTKYPIEQWGLVDLGCLLADHQVAAPSLSLHNMTEGEEYSEKLVD